MEIILAMVAASAVIFFGALISMGNERQRNAIENLREQVALWAIKDIKLKSNRLTHEVKIDDPLPWFNQTASRVCAYDLKLQVLEVVEEPQSLICVSGDGDLKVIFSPLSPLDIHRIKNGRQSRLSQFAGQNPLLHLPKSVNIHELSPLNSGHLFDLEMALAWKSLTNQSITNTERIWMYLF